MKKKDLNKLNSDELNTKLIDNQEALVNLRFQKALQQLDHPQQIRLIRKEIAQVKTAIIFAALGVNGITKITGKILSRDHTEKMLISLSDTIKI